MPQAPPLLAPTAAPSLQGTPEINLPVPVDAFGGAVGKALEGLGGSLEHVSNDIWQRAMEMQNLQNETSAKEADAQYMIKSGMLHADFLNKEGENAGPQALADHIQKLQDLRTDLRAGLNPMASKMYDASSLSFMGRNIFNAAGHSGQQVKVAANHAADSRIQAASNDIGDKPTDEGTFQRQRRVIESEVEAQGRNNGWSEDQTNETKSEAVSTAYAKRIAGLSRTDAIGAKAMFDQASKAGALTPVNQSRVEATVQSQFRQQGSRGISDKILGDFRNGGDADKTEQEFIDEGVKEAEATKERLGITDPLFTDFVRDRISADYRRQKAVARDGEQASEQTVAAALMQGNKEGILPKSVDELKLVDPSVAAAWDNLKPTTQRKYMSALAQNASGEKVAWTDQSLRSYQQLKGMAHDAPVEFLAHDVIADKMPSSAKRELINLQQRLKSQSDADPRVGRALQILGPDLQAAGIDKKSDLDGYRQFTGALADQLDQFQHDHKKVPSMEEVRTMGAQLMQAQATGRSGWIPFTKETAPAYQMPVPDEERTRLRNDPYWNHNNIQPNDAMIDRIYRAQKFKELYGGTSGKTDKGTGVQFPPNG